MKIVIKLTNIIFLIFIVFCFDFCTKERKVYLISEEFKHWTVFNTGSYWLYNNEVSHKIDSVYLLTSPTSNFSNNYNSSTDEAFKETISYSLKSPFLGFFLIETNGRSDYLLNSTKKYFVHLLFLDHSSGFEILEFIENFNVNDRNFSGVIHTRNYDFSAPSGDTATIDSYFVKNVGIIKYIQKIGKSDTTWTLVNYHTVQ